jgi:hypothetical protein
MRSSLKGVHDVTTWKNCLWDVLKLDKLLKNSGDGGKIIRKKD